MTAERAKPFRIVHLSDLHLTSSKHDRRFEGELFKPLKGMNESFKNLLKTTYIRQADFIIVTGDITDRGSVKAWSHFWKTIAENGFTDRIAVVPGNHDMCCLGLRLPGKRRLYKKHDLDKAVNGLKMGKQDTRFPTVIQPDDRVVIFSLNSNNLGNLNVATNALGELGYFQLKRLADKLYQFRHVPVKIVAMHHSPNIPGADTARKRGQRPFSPFERMGHQVPQDQRRALLLLCITHRVRLLIHGHLHIAEDRKVSGIRIVGAPASTEPVFENNITSGFQFYSYTIQGQGGRVRCDLHTVSLT